MGCYYDMNGRGVLVKWRVIVIKGVGAVAAVGTRSVEVHEILTMGRWCPVARGCQHHQLAAEQYS